MKNLFMATAAALALIACTGEASKDIDTGSVVEMSHNDNASSKPKTKETVDRRLPMRTEKDINARLDLWFEEQYQEALRRSPMFMAQMGMKERSDEWDDPSRVFALEGLDRTRQSLEEMESSFDFEQLDPDHQLSYRLYAEQAENQLEGAKWWYHNYPFNQMFGAQSRIPTFLLNYHGIETEKDAQNYIARLNGIEDYLGGILKVSKASAAKNIMPPKFVYDHVIRDAENVLTGAPFDDGDYNVLLNDFRKKVEKLDLDNAAKEDLYAGAIDALTNSVGPAYQALITEMTAQQAKTTTDDGVWKLPDAKDYYANRLNRMTTTDMSADEIHDLGLKEVERIHTEMRAIMKNVKFDGDLQDFFQHLKDDPKQTYPDSEAGREQYLADATDMIETMKKELDSVFIKKPKADLIVKRVEAFREKSAGKAFYNRPAPDGSKPGMYYANLYKISDMPKYQMEALAYHEGIPGHHMQIAIAQELESVPKFRKFGGVTAYTEGWGLYSEYLPKEMGFYEDPYSDFGRLAMELWRAARLVVDTGLHDKKWTREKAIKYLTDNTPNPENDCIKAIERYIVMPGQATAYKIGMLKILDLRENAKDRLGKKFDIREFHDVVLASGAVPLNILEENVDAWVAEKAGLPGKL